MKRFFCILTLLLLLLSALPMSVAATATEEDAPKYEFFPTEIGTRAHSSKAESPLWQKTALFLGDSICYNKAEQLKDPATAGWPGRIGPAYEMEWYNLGYSGATVSMTRDNCTPNQLLSALEKTKTADLILLQGGINDAYSGIKLGSIEEGFSLHSFDTTTYAGSMQQLFALCRRYYPDAQVFYLIHHTTPNSLTDNKPNVPKADPINYVHLTKEICEKWEIPYLNLYEDETFNTKIFDTANNTTGCMWPDLLHMSTTGYDVLTPYLIAWMEHFLIAEEANEFLTKASEAQDAILERPTLPLEEHFLLLRDALAAYAELGSAARFEYRQEIFDLLCLVDEYNQLADTAAAEASTAYTETPTPVTVSHELLAGLWISLRQRSL